jgi:hypothetical protein
MSRQEFGGKRVAVYARYSSQLQREASTSRITAVPFKRTSYSPILPSAARACIVPPSSA